MNEDFGKTKCVENESILHLRAQDDTSWHPRQLYVRLEGSNIIDVVDEGYDGPPAWARGNGIWPVEIVITPAEYRRWKPLAAKRSEVES